MPSGEIDSFWTNLPKVKNKYKMVANEKKAWELYPAKTKIGQAQREAYLKGLEANEKAAQKTLEFSHDILTEDEFKQLFGLKPKCTVPQEFLENVSTMFVGSKLLYDEFFKKIRTKSPMGFNDSNIELSSSTEYRKGWRDLILALGDRPHVSVYFAYIGEKSSGRDIPFWTCKTWEDPQLQALMSVAYSTIETKLNVINGDFAAKFGVSYPFNLDKYQSNNWFWRIQGIDLHKPVYFKDENGVMRKIGGYDLKRVMANVDNVFVGKMQEPFVRIIDSVKN